MSRLRKVQRTRVAIQDAAKKLEEGKPFQKVSSSDLKTNCKKTKSEVKERRNSLAQNDLLIGGPPGDRTRDTVIKSHVLYH